MDDKIALTDILMSQFEIFPNFHRPINNPKKRIVSIKFSPSGDKLLAASNKRTLDLYNCNTAQQESYFELYKHGNSVIDYMDSDDTVLIGSCAVGGDYAIRELNMTKNKYDACYTGHSAPAVSLAVNGEKKYFISGGHDKSALVFDFRVPSAQVSLADLPCWPLVALHPKVDICALGLENNRIELYDLRSLDHGPFCVFRLNVESIKWTNLKFSSDGKQLLISSNSSKIRLIDSFNGVVQKDFCSKFRRAFI